MTTPSVSVIIPTYQRLRSLQLVIAALEAQDYPKECFEIIVVDDGSPEPVVLPNQTKQSYVLNCIRQDNYGATIARNYGAQQSSGDVLAFLDDDVDPVPAALTGLVKSLQMHARSIVLGQLALNISQFSGIYPRVMASLAKQGLNLDVSPYQVHFFECMTGMLAIWRDDFFRLGMFENPTGGWPNWDDVDFGYRAHRSGYRFLRSSQALGFHRDHSLMTLNASCKRIERASYSAVSLFQKYPELFQYLPMFQDKTPISIGKDSTALMLHKSMHSITAWGPMLSGLEKLVPVLERFAPQSALLVALYRWISSAYIYRGFRCGLQDLARDKEAK